MAAEVVMPQLGLSMDSGRIVRWLKPCGQRVAAGDVLLEVESEKAIVEVEAPEGGTLHIVRQPGDVDIPVGEVIAYLLADGEPPPGVEETSPAAPPAQAASRPDRPPSTPAARRRAREMGVDWRRAVSSGPRGQIKERDVLQMLAAPATATSITPVARHLAESAGLDVEELARRAPGRRLERADVEQAIREAVAAIDTARRPAQRRPMGRLRRRIAERMAHSARTNAAVTLTTEADATDLVHLREQIKSDPAAPPAPSYNAILAKLLARALVEHPALNASLDGDEIVTWETVHIAVAVDTEAGLVVPVIRDVQAKPLLALAAEMDALLARAREGKALPDELTGSTFTLTNLGTYEIDAFTPLINPPECAVLGVGRFRETWVMDAGRPVARQMVALSLTFDHRLVDGAPAARFLQRVKQLVEHPCLAFL